MIVDDDDDEEDGDDDDDGMGWDGRTAACVVRNEQSSMYAWSPSELIRYVLSGNLDDSVVLDLLDDLLALVEVEQLYLSIYLPIYPSIDPSIHPSIHPYRSISSLHLQVKDSDDDQTCLVLSSTIATLYDDIVLAR